LARKAIGIGGISHTPQREIAVSEGKCRKTMSAVTPAEGRAVAKPTKMQ
jgi:hypothetical protein